MTYTLSVCVIIYDSDVVSSLCPHTRHAAVINCEEVYSSALLPVS